MEIMVETHATFRASLSSTAYHSAPLALANSLSLSIAGSLILDNMLSFHIIRLPSLRPDKYIRALHCLVLKTYLQKMA